MRNKIYKVVEELVFKYKTSNPFELCEKLGLTVKYVSYGKGFIFNSCLIQINNKKYTKASTYVICAHELGHAVLHNGDSVNYFDESNTLEKIEKDRQANLFAAYLLFEDDNDIKFENMNSQMIKNFIESHIEEIK